MVVAIAQGQAPAPSTSAVTLLVLLVVVVVWCCSGWGGEQWMASFGPVYTRSHLLLSVSIRKEVVIGLLFGRTYYPI